MWVPRAHGVGQTRCHCEMQFGHGSSGMDSAANGILILDPGMLIESSEAAFEAASATDDRTMSMPTTTGKRTAKIRTTLTKRVTDALQPTDTAWIAWDDKLVGFGVRVHPTGTKAFIISYRTGDGGRKAPSRRVVIGRCGRVTPDQAGRLAPRLLGQVAGGSDPAFEHAMPSLGGAFEDYMTANPNRPETDRRPLPLRGGALSGRLVCPLSRRH